MIIEALKDYTPDQIEAAKKNETLRGREPEWMVELFFAAGNHTQYYTNSSNVWKNQIAYDDKFPARLHPDAEPPEPDTTIELSDAPIVTIRCTGDACYEIDIPDDDRIVGIGFTGDPVKFSVGLVSPGYPPLPDDPEIGKRYTTEDGVKVECVASDEIDGSCSLGGIPECVFYDTDCEGIHCVLPQRRYITIADADTWHAGQADPVIQAAAELSAAIEEHEERRETQPGEWEECEVKYINCLPYVTMPAWHTDRRSRKTPTMYAAQWLDGFGGVQLEGQASKQEWYHGPVFLDECSNPIWTASEPEHKPARVTKSRFMRPNAAEE